MSKTMSIIKRSFVLAGIVLAAHGCTLDVTPTDKYTEETIFKNPENMELYVAGLYAEFQTFKFGQFPIGYSNATDALTDIEKYTSSTSGNGTVNILAMDASRVNAAGPQLNYWSSGYARIRRINEFLSGLYKYAKLSDDAKAMYEAEARFVRGYTYFWLVKLHGSVVLMPGLEDYKEKNRQRSSEEDCWKYIAADFAYAAEKLPVTQPATRTGRATKGAAYGMLARTWLYAASIAEYDKKAYNQDPLTGVAAASAATYYQNAAAAAGEVIKLAGEGIYGLEAKFADIFLKRDTKEAIFKLDFVAPQFTHQYDFGFTPPGDIPGQGMVYGVPTAELVNEFEMADGSKFSWSNAAQAAEPYKNREPRFYASVLYNGASWKGRTIDSKAGTGIENFTEYGISSEPKRTVTGYYIKKMLDSTNINFVQNKSIQSWLELRYAEILLIAAEARAKSNNIGGAQEALNTLRKARYLPENAPGDVAGLMKAIEHERMVELAFEGHRYWDLRRWRKAHTVLNGVRFTGHKITPQGAGFKYEVVPADNANRQFTPALYYIPIPQDEIQRNTAITQIQGW
ncbi:RagB/SusD family nutrient uptake outer membrane protein [Chitinophaga lutea]|uniref:RagB/SusD family nutrient uptake outer membrane protein n=2 Tax=Chitinophaga lutea TaxID=2488634 RepID=A0A3N4PLH4_9BACT|nr:RagB/SusD family nutrient uptake outer membrane protein [Chitinophaga lutea]